MNLYSFNFNVSIVRHLISSWKCLLNTPEPFIHEDTWYIRRGCVFASVFGLFIQFNVITKPILMKKNEFLIWIVRHLDYQLHCIDPLNFKHEKWPEIYSGTKSKLIFISIQHQLTLFLEFGRCQRTMIKYSKVNNIIFWRTIWNIFPMFWFLMEFW